MNSDLEANSQSSGQECDDSGSVSKYDKSGTTPTRSPKKSSLLMNRISMFDNDNKPANLPVKSGSPVVTRKKIRNKLDLMAGQSPQLQSLSPIATPETVARHFTPATPTTPSDYETPTLKSNYTNLSLTFDAPLEERSRQGAPIRKSSVQHRLSMFEKKNKKVLDISTHSRGGSRRPPQNSFKDIDGILSPRYTLKSKAIGNKSSEPAPYVTPAIHRVKMPKDNGEGLPQMPLSPAQPKNEESNVVRNDSLRAGTLRSTGPPGSIKNKVGVKQQGSAKDVYVTQQEEHARKEDENGDDASISQRSALRGFNRPDAFDLVSLASVKRSWKPKGMSGGEVQSSSDHSLLSMTSDGTQDFSKSYETKTPKSCSGEVEEDLFDEGVSDEESDENPRKRSWKIKREISIEQANDTNSETKPETHVQESAKKGDHSDDLEDVNSLQELPKRSWKPKNGSPSQVVAQSIYDQGIEPDESTPKRSWRPTRELSVEEVNAMAQKAEATDEGEQEINEVPSKFDRDESSDMIINQRSWKPKRVISIEEMKEISDDSDHSNEENDYIQHSKGKYEGGSENSSGRREASLPNDDYASPIRVKEKQSSQVAGGRSSPPKNPLNGGSTHSTKSSKLTDRIKLFNYGSPPSSPQPQPAFLSSEYMNKLIEKKETQQNEEVASIPIFSADVVDADNYFEAESQAIDQFTALIEEKPHITWENSEPKIIRGNTDMTEATAKQKNHSFPKSKISLDKAKAAESDRKRIDKHKSKSFNLRGKLKATRSALVGQKNKDKNAVFANVLAGKEDLSSHKPPEFAKDDNDKKIIITALRKNFVFEEMDEKDMGKLLAAMEQVKVSGGKEIITQGDQGDYFYVVAKGDVTFFVDGRKVGTAGPGNSFGELALLYTCPRAATVRTESHPTTLFRVDQKTFRFMTQSQTKKSEEEKKKLLLHIPFLSSLGTEDIARLCSVMKPVLFFTGDYIVQKGEHGSSFFILRDGRARVTEIFVGGTKYEDIFLGQGDYFGEDALISIEARAANVVALTKGTAFSIDRESVQKVLGDFGSLVSKAQDRQKLESMKILRDIDLASSDFDTLAKLISDKSFVQNAWVFKQMDKVHAALYIVREGTVRITTWNGKKDEIIGVGGAFGQDQLLADSGGPEVPNCKITAQHTVTVVSDCVCGILTLEDCRTVFDTTALGDRIFSGGNSALEQQRAEMRELMQSNVKLDDLDKDRIIGEGQFGTVWLVRADPHGSKDSSQMLEFAMKVQFKEDPVRRDGAIEAIKREMTVINQLNHPFIIDLVDKYETEDQLMMLTEAVKGGELWSRIHQENDDGNWSSGISETDSKFYALVIADTVAYMHRQKFIFRDLKPENVLIDAEGYPTLCDFGFAKYCPDKTYTFCGTPNYLAPEIVLNRGHNAAVDHWALGIVTYEMITGENPFYFEGQDQMSLLQAIVQEAYYPLPDTSSPELVDFMNGLLEKDPVQRLGSLAGGVKGILKHKWFSNLDVNKMRNKKAKAPYIPDIP